MTQPDQLTPESAANYGSLAVFAGKSQDDWEDEIKTGELDRWGGVNSGMRGGLDLSYPLPVAILRFLAYKLGLGGVLDTLDKIGDALRDFFDDLGGVVSQVVRGIKTGVNQVGQGVADFTEWLLGLMGFGQIHAAGNLFGTGQIGDVNPELLINGGFDTAASMPSDIGGWVWDGAVDHTGRSGSGSAKVVANGAFRSMLSNQVDVVPSNVVTASVWLKWQNRSGSGPVSLVLNVYDENDTLIDTVSFKTASTDTASDWVKLSGSYTVPKLIGAKKPTHVCAGFYVDPQVTSGTFWWDDASLQKINPISHKLVDGFQDAIDNVTEKAGSGLGDFVEALQNFDRIKTGTVLDHFVPGVGLLIENGIRGLLGLPPETTEYTHEQFLEAAKTAAEATLGNGRDITDIWRYLNAGIYDEFERSGNSLGSNWATPWGSGQSTLKTEGHNAYIPYVWPGGDSQWFTRWVGTNASSVSDYQQTSIVLATGAGSAFGWCGHNDILGRVSGSTHYIRFRVGGDGSWSLLKFVNSVAYTMAAAPAGSIQRPGPGAIITLYCGDKATSNPRQFKVTINGRVICDLEEPTGVPNVPDSVYGASYRGRGFGMRAEGLPFLSLGWVTPGLVNYWSGSDQP